MHIHISPPHDFCIDPTMSAIATAATVKTKADEVAEKAGPGGLATVAATAAVGGAASLVLGAPMLLAAGIHRYTFTYSSMHTMGNTM